jgi:hypothetical protein
MRARPARRGTGQPNSGSVADGRASLYADEPNVAGYLPLRQLALASDIASANCHGDGRAVRSGHHISRHRPDRSWADQVRTPGDQGAAPAFAGGCAQRDTAVSARRPWRQRSVQLRRDPRAFRQSVTAVRAAPCLHGLRPDLDERRPQGSAAPTDSSRPPPSTIVHSALTQQQARAVLTAVPGRRNALRQPDTGELRVWYQLQRLPWSAGAANGVGYRGIWPGRRRPAGAVRSLRSTGSWSPIRAAMFPLRRSSGAT